jgi:hypothetical protein
MKIILFLLFLLFAPQSTLLWNLYPNPAHDHFTVEVAEGELLPYVKIYDWNGRLVQQETIGSGQRCFEIYIHLKPGKYIVYLSGEK